MDIAIDSYEKYEERYNRNEVYRNTYNKISIEEYNRLIEKANVLMSTPMSQRSQIDEMMFADILDHLAFSEGRSYLTMASGDELPPPETSTFYVARPIILKGTECIPVGEILTSNMLTEYHRMDSRKVHLHNQRHELYVDELVQAVMDIEDVLIPYRDNGELYRSPPYKTTDAFNLSEFWDDNSE